MKHRKPLPARAYQAGYFSEPVRAWTSMRFEPQIVVNRRTGRIETDFERAAQIRGTSGWNSIPVQLPGSFK